MTATCSVCKMELVTTIEEYGDIRHVLCRTCWFDDQMRFTPQYIQSVDDEIHGLENDIDYAEREIADLEGEKRSMERDLDVLYAKRRAMREHEAQDATIRMAAWVDAVNGIYQKEADEQGAVAELPAAKRKRKPLRATHRLVKKRNLHRRRS